MREIEFKIKEQDEGKQIRDFLRDFGVSAALMVKLKRTENGITVNGEFSKAIEHLKTDDILKIAIANSGQMPEPLESKDVKLVYEDEDILVLDKPPFMPVHESRNHQGDSLANVAANYMEKDTAFRAIFRLDRDTSGLVLIAKNELAAAKLAGKISKDYYAICTGELRGCGTIDEPIKRLGDSIIKRGVSSDGERAITHWEAIKTNGEKTLVKLKLDTGRTHQIRVHFFHIGHPLLGDTLYGHESSEIDRQALHCKTLYFTHPITEESMEIDSEFPDDFRGLI